MKEYLYTSGMGIEVTQKNDLPKSRIVWDVCTKIKKGVPLRLTVKSKAWRGRGKVVVSKQGTIMMDSDPQEFSMLTWWYHSNTNFKGVPYKTGDPPWPSNTVGPCLLSARPYPMIPLDWGWCPHGPHMYLCEKEVTRPNSISKCAWWRPKHAIAVLAANGDATPQHFHQLNETVIWPKANHFSEGPSHEWLLSDVEWLPTFLLSVQLWPDL